MKTIKAKFHTYSFDTSTREGLDAWAAFQAAREAEGLEVFATYGDDRRVATVDAYYKAVDKLDGREIELELAHVFDNQWHTAPVEGITESGLRIFDWQQDIWHNVHIKSGHYVEQTDEMREVRRNTMTCGYCGKQEPAAKGYAFCPHCLDSPYLEESQLYLTRMVCARDSSKRDVRKPLTAAESADLVPRYRDAQINGSAERGRKRIEKARKDIEAEYAQTCAHATEKRDAARWIIANAPGMLENWIYYTHTGKHCFGWRKPLDAGTRDALLEKISEFPFAYEIKCDDGRKLEGY